MPNRDHVQLADRLPRLALGDPTPNPSLAYGTWQAEVEGSPQKFRDKVCEDEVWKTMSRVGRHVAEPTRGTRDFP